MANNYHILEKVRNKLPFDSLYHMHLPKTGGTYMDNTLGKNSNYIKGLHKFCISGVKRNGLIPDFRKGSDTWPCHLSEYQFRRSIRIAIIRNPFTWLPSYYSHVAGRVNIDEYSGWYGCNDYHGFNSFEEFIKCFCDDDFIWHCPEIRNFMLAPLFDINGNCRADLLIMNEHLSEAIEVLATEFDFKIENKVKPRKRKQGVNTEYTENMIELVMNKCQKELELFAYSYNGNERYECSCKVTHGWFVYRSFST